MEQKIDVLNREKFVEETKKILDALSKNRKSCCFAINGKWGAGKTFVLDMIKNYIETKQTSMTNGDQYFLFDYNCWEYDYYDEPAISIISSMIISAEQKLSGLPDEVRECITSGWGLVVDQLKEIAGDIVEKHIGVNPIKIWDKMESGIEEKEKKYKEFNELYAFTQIIENARTKIKKIAEDRTVVIIVDELDRCIPIYAIKVLERLHHVFEGIENVIVMVAIDKNQLIHSIKTIYGDEVDIEQYLKKFIDFEKTLDNGELDFRFWDKYEMYLSRFNMNSEEKEFMQDVIRCLFKEINIREQERLMRNIEISHSLIALGKYDVSLLLFELLVGRYKKIFPDGLQDILEISRNTTNNKVDVKIRERIGDKAYFNFIKPLVEQSVKRGRLIIVNNGEETVTASDNVIGKAFWLLAEIYCERNKYRLDDEKLHAELESISVIAREFVEISKSIY